MNGLSRTARAAACGFTLMILPGCGGEEPEAGPPPSGAVSSATPEATAAGIRILALGGNAVDAAVAVSLTLGATEPSESGLGGSVVMLISPAGGEPVLVHAPPEVITPAGGGPAVLRPTALPVLVHAWRRYGSGAVSWEQLVEPARLAAERGHTLGRFRHRMIVSEYRRLQSDSLGAALMLNPDRSIPGEGTVVRMPVLAATLERLAGAPVDELPAGELTAEMTAELAGQTEPAAAAPAGSLPQVREDQPLVGSYRGWTVLAPREPYAGRFVLRALEFLQGAPVALLRRNDEVRALWLAEALGYARAPAGPTLLSYVSTLPPLPIAVDSAQRAASLRPRPARPPQGPATAPPPSEPVPPRDTVGTETSHFSIVDGAGTAVSVTQSLGGPFGARASRLGFFYARPASATPAPTPDSAGALLAPISAVQTTAPSDLWEDQVTWAVPTILLREGVPSLVLGSAGGPRAASSVVQVVADWVDGGRPLERAVAAPRLHVDPDTPRPRLSLEGVIWIDQIPGAETGLAPWGMALRQMATQRGLRLGEWITGLEYLGLSPAFGGVNAVAREEQGWTGAADPRRDGVGRALTDEDVLRARAGTDESQEELPSEPQLPPPLRRESPGRE